MHYIFKCNVKLHCNSVILPPVLYRAPNFLCKEEIWLTTKRLMMISMRMSKDGAEDVAEDVGEGGEKEGAEDEAQTEDEGQAGDVEEVEDKAEDKGEAGVKMPSHHKRHQEEVVDSCCLKKMQHKIRPIMKHNWW